MEGQRPILNLFGAFWAYTGSQKAYFGACLPNQRGLVAYMGAFWAYSGGLEAYFWAFRADPRDGGLFQAYSCGEKTYYGPIQVGPF